jgi:hypothetical protein
MTWIDYHPDTVIPISELISNANKKLEVEEIIQDFCNSKGIGLKKHERSIKTGVVMSSAVNVGDGDADIWSTTLGKTNWKLSHEQ